MRYLVIVEYDGTNYYGWQKQKPQAQLSVSQEIERVLSKVLDAPITIRGSGRTDRYVHALGQTFHFDADQPPDDLSAFLFSLNALVSPDIHFKKIKRVSTEFNARLSARGKEYHYVINNHEYNPFRRNFEAYYKTSLNLEKMQEAAQLFLGCHSFKNFTTKGSDIRQYERVIHSFTIIKKQDRLYFKIRGDGFMRYMVRFIVGALIQIGLGRIEASYIRERLQKNAVKNICQYKAEPHGLYLYKVFY